MINFIRAIELAWERTMIILFRPWDPEKWFVIGINAFLMLLAGGVSFNSTFDFQTQQNRTKNYTTLHDFLHDLNRSFTWLRSPEVVPWLMAFVWLAAILLILWFVLMWVGCRGQFLFLDNVVRNRAAFLEPWHRYARQGNTWFIFNLVLMFASTILTVIVVVVFFSMTIVWISAERVPTASELWPLVGAILVLLVFSIIFSAALFIVRSFAIPLMFRGYGFWAALGEVGRITMAKPVSIALYVVVNLILIIIGIFVAFVLFFATCCMSCCTVGWLTALPIVGSILTLFIFAQILLPLLVFSQCFQLDCLAQCGPQYDVWTVDVPPSQI